MEEEDAGGFVVASFVEAIHETSGERFLLAYLADKIVAVSPQSDGAHGVLPAGAHTSRWANRQRWRVGRSRGV